MKCHMRLAKAFSEGERREALEFLDNFTVLFCVSEDFPVGKLCRKI